MSGIKDIHDLNKINQNFDSLGEPINRFKLSFSNFPFFEGEVADEKILMLIENKLFDYELNEMSFNYIEDNVQGNMILVPHVMDSLSNFNENNLSMTFILDEFRFNYTMFFMWATALIKKKRNLEESEYVESNEEYFIDEITLDILDNQGEPEVIYSLVFEDVALTRLGKLNTKTHETDLKFEVGFRFTNVKFNIDKMEILKSFRNINNTNDN